MQETLFKYLSDAKHVLKDRFIRATQPLALNDPLEAMYCKESLRTLLLELEYDRKTVDLSLKRISALLKEVGVVCLSETRDNLLMWSHYANEHKGLVLKFPLNWYSHNGIFESLFPIDSCSDVVLRASDYFSGEFEPVKYRKQPKFRIDAFDSNYSLNYDDDLLNIVYGILLQKSEEWIYEKEHRAILHLSQSDRVVVPAYRGAPKKTLTLLSKFDEFLERLESIDKRLFYTTTAEGNRTLHVFDLYKIADEYIRAMIASHLKSLSDNPEVVYLFKLTDFAIPEIILGAKSNPRDPKQYAKLLSDLRGTIGVTKAYTDSNSYSLLFQHIGEISQE